MHEKEILSALREAMSEDDSERVEEIIDEYEDDWEDGSLAVKALEIAVETTSTSMTSTRRKWVTCSILQIITTSSNV